MKSSNPVEQFLGQFIRVLAGGVVYRGVTPPGVCLKGLILVRFRVIEKKVLRSVDHSLRHVYGGSRSTSDG